MLKDVNVGDIRPLMPLLVFPAEIALNSFEVQYFQMTKQVGKTPELPELSIFVDTLTKFYKSLEDLKYKLFDLIDRDAEQYVESSRTLAAVDARYAKAFAEIGIETDDIVVKTIEETEGLEKTLVKYILKGIDPKIKRTKRLIEMAKDLQKHFKQP